MATEQLLDVLGMTATETTTTLEPTWRETWGGQATLVLDQDEDDDGFDDFEDDDDDIDDEFDEFGDDDYDDDDDLDDDTDDDDDL